MPRTEAKRATVKDFSGGLNTVVPPVNLPDNVLPDIMNFNPFNGSCRKRLGQADFGTGLPSDPLLLKEVQFSSGTRGTIVQCNDTASKSGGTENKALWFFESGNGSYSPIAWYNSGTANFAAGTSVTITPTGNSTAQANMRTATDYWIRAESGADQLWYKVASVSGNTVTLDTAHTGTGGAVAYRIVKVLPYDVQGWLQGVFKDNAWLLCSGSEPQRFDGSHAHYYGNLTLPSAVTASAGNPGNVDAGNHRIVGVYDYGTLDRSAPIMGAVYPTDNVIAVSAPNQNLTLTIPRGPQAVVNGLAYAQKSGVDAADPYFYVGKVANTGATLTVAYNISDADLESGAAARVLADFPLGSASNIPTMLEIDSAVDVGCKLPPNASLGIFVSGRSALKTDDNPSVISWSKVDAPGCHPSLNADAISPEDGQSISGFGVSYGALMVFKDRDKIFVYDNNTPGAPVQQVNTDLGAKSPNIPSRNGWLYWLTKDGVARGNARGAQIISGAITNSLRSIKQVVTKLGRVWLTSQAQLDDPGSLFDSNISVANGEITLAQHNFNLDTYAEFQTGTYSNTVSARNTLNVGSPAFGSRNYVMLSKVTNNSVALGFDIANGVIGDGFASGTGWTNRANANDGDHSTYAETTVNSSQNRTLSVGLSTGNWDVISALASVSYASDTLNVNVRVDAYFEIFDQNASAWVTLDHRLLDTTTNGFSTLLFTSSTGGMLTVPRAVGNSRLRFEYLSGGTMIVRVNYLSLYEAGFKQTGTYTTAIQDTGVTTPGMGTFDPTVLESYFYSTSGTLEAGVATAPAGNGVSVTWRVRSGSTPTWNPATWGNYVAVVPGNQFPIYTGATDGTGIHQTTFQRYFQVEATLLSGQGQKGTPRITAIIVNYYAQGVYVSRTIDTGVTPTRWGTFDDERDPGAGTIQAAIATAASDPPVTFTNASPGAKITNTVNEFVQVQYTLTPPTAPSSGSSIPVVRAFGFDWYYSSAPAAKYRAALEIFHDTLYVSVERAQGDALYNDRVYLADLRALDEDRMPPWTRYDWKLNDMCVSGNVFYGASSAKGTNSGKVYILEASGVYTDDGASNTAITAYFRVKPYDFDSLWKHYRRISLALRETRGNNTTIKLFPVGEAFAPFTVSATTLPQNTGFSPSYLESDFNDTGDGVERQAAGWTGPVEPLQLRGASPDYRITGRGHYFSVVVVHDSANQDVIEVYGFSVTFDVRDQVGTY